MSNYEIANHEYTRWLTSEAVSGELRDELNSIADSEPAIIDRFWRGLSFGTGGLRGVIGAGINRMNLLVVQRVTQGLADFIEESIGTSQVRASVCIAYDTRNMSREFAEVSAKTLCVNGIKVFLFTGVHPTPMLSFAVREKRALAGIVITASHNPPEYNGYKVYGADGGQITDEVAGVISRYISNYDILAEAPLISLEEARKDGLLFDLDDVDALYYERVKALVVRRDIISSHARELSILYTPLHGTGNIPVRRVLSELGFSNLSSVEEQEQPDGDFPTVPYPNPEEAEAFSLALAKANGQDIILATDPDCDRIGVYARNDSGGFTPLTGNQIGALLCDYLIVAYKGKRNLLENPSEKPQLAVVKTIVTTELARQICARNDIALVETLTGFKYIGEKISEWDSTGEYSFLFGFEESYGYLAGDFVRDKDAVIAAALICEMALYYKLNGLTLHGALENLYLKYGYADERLISFKLDGADGMERIGAIMRSFRSGSAALMLRGVITATEDYLGGIRGLPLSDVVKIIFSDGSWLAVRPSGTEPKVKFYIGATGDSREAVEARLQELSSAVSEIERVKNETILLQDTVSAL